MSMDQNKMPILAKKFFKIFRVAYFMLRRGISKGLMLAELNIMMKRGKIAGKLAAMQNLMFHHHHHHHHKSHAPSPIDGDSMADALKIINMSAATSPSLTGFVPSPIVVRVTDSPFPLSDVEEDHRVDEAAEEFIMKFYRELREQKSRGSSPWGS